ncbi:S24 family peptidase [Enterocloster alcoholdehydrogenati]|uniref:S24 family peptidase n=2 Tax=Enterocloster alcoholdehydrogenati TaxID=2547410 RepID=UPI001FAB87EB|nr:S24 family peptidase [Enterocloster alcoholdehydrogenati]
MKTTTANRLKKVMDQNGLRQVDILKKAEPYCKKFGVKLGRNDLSQYISGKVSPGQEKLTVLALALNVSEAWLMGFDVPMERIDPELLQLQKESRKNFAEKWNIQYYEKQLLKYFTQLIDENKKRAIRYTENLCNVQKMEEEQGYKYIQSPTSATIVEFHPKQESKIIALPYFRAGASAGTGIFILGNEAEDEIELPALPEYEAADFAIDVNGDSMEPDFSNEDIALVQRDAEMYVGDIGVFIVNGDAFIKELGEKELISKNKEYKNIPIRENDNVVCMGKVIGKVIY